jgi:hypothetical protein
VTPRGNKGVRNEMVADNFLVDLFCTQGAAGEQPRPTNSQERAKQRTRRQPRLEADARHLAVDAGRHRE